MYPHFWHPFKQILTTASQYMVVAISVERYIAICHKSIAPPKPTHILVCLIVFSLTLNLPRFCEFISHQLPTIKENTQINSTQSNSSENGVEKQDDDQFSLQYHTSRLGENPQWVLFIACHEIVVIIVCLVTICFCNFQVWLQVLNSSELKIQR